MDSRGEEKRALEKQFSSFIRRNKTPGQIDCQNAQQKEPSLKKIHWSKIKFAVKNMISSKKRKQVSQGEVKNIDCTDIYLKHTQTL